MANPQSHQDTSPSVPPTGGARILLVDQSPSGKTLAAALRHDGYVTRVVASADEAGALLAQESFDLLLVDMPADDTATHQLVAHVRGAPGAPTTIVLTSYASLETALRSLRAGAYDYLVKPIDVDELRLTLTHAIERRRLQRELSSRVGELEEAHQALRTLNSQLQERVAAATSQLQAQVQALDEANQRLSVTQAQHERFVAMVAHEMRGPLSPIMNYATLAKRPNISAEKRDEFLDYVVEHTNRMARLVDDLQTATRLSAGQFILKIGACDIAAALEELVAQFASAHRERAFSFTRPLEPVVVDVDADRILQSARNLFDNAIKHTGEGGAIEVAVRVEGDRALIAVGDYGPGIPEEEMERIFQAYIRLQKRDEDEPSGSGLGLYITRGIVAAHGGALTVQNRSEQGRLRGAIFTIALPLHHGVVKVAEEAHE